MSTPRRKRTQLDTIDVDTFKAWLQGVEDMQGADWCPTLDQWRKIRQKIEQLEVQEAEPPQPAATPYPGAPYYPPGVRTINDQAGGFVPAASPRPLIPATPPSSLDAKPSDSNVGHDGQYNSSFS